MSASQKSNENSLETMRNDPNLIKVYDKYGRELFITKEEWKKNILPSNLKKHWNEPDELYNTIVSALNDEFYNEVLNASKRLYKIDTNHERSACIFGIVLMKLKKLSKAESILKKHISKHGKSGVILTNLAKVYADQGKKELSKETLYDALISDPNQDNAISWWGAIHFEKGGQESYIKSVKEISKIKGSWRPQLWLARNALETKNKEQAMQYYRHVLGLLKPIPSDVMMQISGDLGNNGFIKEIVELFEDKFDIEIHGFSVGNNMLKSYIHLNKIEKAKKLLNNFQKLQRPDLREHLDFWENEIAKAEGKYGVTKEQKDISVSTLVLNFPVWCQKIKDYEKLLPEKDNNSAVIGTVTFSCNKKSNGKKVLVQKADYAGDLSRTIPLYILEKIILTTNAKARLFVPTVTDKGAFIFSSQPWKKDAIQNFNLNNDINYFINGHMEEDGEMMKVEIEIIDVRNNFLAKKYDYVIHEKNIGIDVYNLVEHLIKNLIEIDSIQKKEPKFQYVLPKKENLTEYYYSIAQSLALSVATDVESSKGLHGERNIIDRALFLNVAEPEKQILKILYIGMLLKNKAYKSNVYLEYKDKTLQLMNEYKPKGLVHEILSKSVKELYK